MAKTTTVILGGQEYTVKAFTLDDLEEVAGILGTTGQFDGATSVKILKIALRNAEPPIDKAGKIHIDSLQELSEATNAILKLAGLEVKENPTMAATGAA